MSSTKAGKKSLVCSPDHQLMYDDFVVRVEARKAQSKARMRNLMDGMVEEVYSHVVHELKSFVHQISVHGDKARVTTGGHGRGSKVLHGRRASSGNVRKPFRMRPASPPPSPSSPIVIPDSNIIYNDALLNAQLLDDATFPFGNASLSGNSSLPGNPLLTDNARPNYDVHFESSSSSLYNAQTSGNSQDSSTLYNAQENSALFNAQSFDDDASLSVSAPLPGNGLQPNNGLQKNAQENATLCHAQTSNAQSCDAPQTMQPYNASENIMENGIEGQNAEEPSVHNAVINAANNGGGDNDLDNAHYHDALDDFQDDAFDNSQDNARENALDNFQNYALDDSQDNASLGNASVDHAQVNNNTISNNENSLNDSTSQLSLDIGAGGDSISQASGGEDNSNNTETMRTIKNINEVVANAQDNRNQQKQPQLEDSSSNNSGMESSPEVTEKHLRIVERLMNKALGKGMKNSQDNVQNNAQDNSQDSDDGPTATSTPIAQNRTAYWRIIKAERRKLEQQQANVTMPQQQQLENSHHNMNDAGQNNAQQENDVPITTTMNPVKIKEELDDGTTAVEVTMAAAGAGGSLSPSVNRSNTPPQSPPVLLFQSSPPRQPSAVKKQKVGPENNNREPKVAPTKKKIQSWTNRRIPNPVLPQPSTSAASLSSSIIPKYYTAGTSRAAGPKLASEVLYLKKVKGTPLRGKILVKAIRCNSCPSYLPSRTELYRHLKAVHKLSPIRCPLRGCGARFDVMQQFGGHTAQKHRRNFHWPCTECPRPTDPSVPPVVFERCQDLNNHIRCTHEEGIFACPVEDCGFEGAKGHLVTEHYDAMHRAERGSLENIEHSGDDESIGAGDVPNMPGDEQMAPRDVPIMPGDVPMGPGDLPLVPHNVPMIPGEVPLVPRNFPMVYRDLPMVPRVVPVIPANVPMVPGEPLPRGQQPNPVTDEQEKKKIKTEEQVIKTEPTDEEIRQMVMKPYMQQCLQYPRLTECPWIGCDYTNYSCMLMARHVQTAHLGPLVVPKPQQQPQVQPQEQPQVPREPIKVTIVVKKEPEQAPPPRQQNVVRNQTQQPKKTNPGPMVIKEEIDESNNNQPTVRN